MIEQIGSLLAVSFLGVLFITVLYTSSSNIERNKTAQAAENSPAVKPKKTAKKVSVKPAEGKRDSDVSRNSRTMEDLPPAPGDIMDYTDSCETKLYDLDKWTSCERFFFLTSPIRGYYNKFSDFADKNREFYFASHPLFHEDNIIEATIKTPNKKGFDTVANITESFSAPLNFEMCKSYETGCDFSSKININTSNFEPGLYLLKIVTRKNSLVRDSTVSFPFIVKPKVSKPMLLVYPNWTHQAYSRSGGLSLYKKFVSNPENHTYSWENFTNAETVSFKRPVEGVRREHRFHVATPLLNFLKSRNEDFTIIAQEDFDSFISAGEAQVLVIFGHNEYWTKENTENVQAFLRNSGKVLNLSGNTLWWWLKQDDLGLTLSRNEARREPITDMALSTFMSADLRSEALFGSSFATAGYPIKSTNPKLDQLKSDTVDLAAKAQEVIIACEPSWVTSAGLSAGQKIGGTSKALNVELDGVPLNQDDFSIDPNFRSDPKSRLRVIGRGPARIQTPFFKSMGVTSITPATPTYSGLISEYVYQDKGRVLNFNSVGATSILSGKTADADYQSLIAQMIEYLKQTEYNEDNIPGCEWFKGKPY